MTFGKPSIQPLGPARRGFLKTLASLPLLGLAANPLAAAAPPPAAVPDRSRLRALLLSATTNPGQASLEHARQAMAELYQDVRDILLINFASLPQDRDAYAERMQRDFSTIHERFRVRSLHHYPHREAARVIREAEAVFVSGGNTFLLLRELYDRSAVELLRERALLGMPYAGSSAGSNIAGLTIGTTNDFPITDIPTRRALGLLPAVFNPHHPAEDEPEFGGRQWKIRQHAAYNPDQPVVGVTNPGMLRLEGERVLLVGRAAAAFVQKGSQATAFTSDSLEGRPLDAAL